MPNNSSYKIWLASWYFFGFEVGAGIIVIYAVGRKVRRWVSSTM